MSKSNDELDDILCKLTTGFNGSQLCTYSEEDTGLSAFEVLDELRIVDRTIKQINAIRTNDLKEVQVKLLEKRMIDDFIYSNITYSTGIRDGYNECLKNVKYIIQVKLKELEDRDE